MHRVLSHTRALVKTIALYLVVLLAAGFALSCSNGPWWTSGACPSARGYGSINRFASDSCIKRLFEPAKLALPPMSTYQRVYWEIERDETTVSVDGQLVPRSRRGPEIVFHASHGFPDVDIVVGSGRYETIEGECVQIYGGSDVVFGIAQHTEEANMDWRTGSISYQLGAIGMNGETRTQLEEALLSIVTNMIEEAANGATPEPTQPADSLSTRTHCQ